MRALRFSTWWLLLQLQVQKEIWGPSECYGSGPGDSNQNQNFEDLEDMLHHCCDRNGRPQSTQSSSCAEMAREARSADTERHCQVSLFG